MISIYLKRCYINLCYRNVFKLIISANLEYKLAMKDARVLVLPSRVTRSDDRGIEGIWQEPIYQPFPSQMPPLKKKSYNVNPIKQSKQVNNTKSLICKEPNQDHLRDL